jgi:uncharacterized protein HemX
MAWDSAAIIGAVALGCTVGGGWLTLFVRERARETAKQQFEESIKAALAQFENSLVRTLNGKYLPREVAEAKFADHDRRIGEAQSEIKELHQYAHSRAHQLANQLQRVMGVVGGD